jgi:UDP-glucose 4-epimerase
MNLSGKKILVIGGAGLIGSHTVDELIKEDVAEIVIFDNFARGRISNLSSALKDPRVSIYPIGGDILHSDILEKAMDGVDGVFHFAAMWLLHCVDYPRSAFNVNVQGTFNVLEAIIKTGVKRLVYSSSASVYGDAVEEPMTENHPHNNDNFYGATKVAGEQMCRSLHKRYCNTEQHFDFVGLRYMNVYGSRQDYRGAYISVIMKMLDSIDNNKAPEVYGDGSQSYDFIYVKDCARANVLAMKAQVSNEFYNVGTGVKTKISELAEIVLESAGSQLSVNYREDGHSFVKNRVGCPLKAKVELGFEYAIDIPEGISLLQDWRTKNKLEILNIKEKCDV